eukprot:CAMPEP_0206386220 /NCGR_PEP_ID=MMETSP0294-20121207/15781_1 /ASSEMBLY_ACC=CAM_ASM_000327 /TAXON_ID=39354 /ORGANISM="Heterosigma akashiwo, Strain CCMP2393" /LENGTH=59 /DNA_ID=CAMNT_0053837161 /DNA_START=321 /DNA_END=500 /DNA_ORIENTATION=+
MASSRELSIFSSWIEMVNSCGWKNGPTLTKMGITWWNLKNSYFQIMYGQKDFSISSMPT